MVLGVAVAMILFAVYMGMFNKLTIEERKFPGGYYVYYDYQGHINSVRLFHQNLQKSLGIDTSKMPQMIISYDDPFNVKDPRTYRASLGFLLKDYDGELFEKFKKLHYQWRSLPSVDSLYGEFPYRNAASTQFGATRFLPTCLTYIMRNSRRLKKVVRETSGTIEIIEGNLLRYYLVIEKPEEFHLTTHAQPEVKAADKFTSVYYKKKND